MTAVLLENVKDVITPKGCISYANHLIELCAFPFPRISSIQDINSNFFVALFECITGHSVPDLLLSDDSTVDVHNIQAVIDTLSLDLLGLSLSHISGEDIVSGNITSIFNLLEVLETLFLFSNTQKEEKSSESSPSGYLPSTVLSASKIRKSISSKSPAESEGITTKSRVLKRKTCRKTLDKHHVDSKRKMSEASNGLPHSECDSDSVDKAKSTLKRKSSKPGSKTAKRLHIEGIEELYDSNFEKKVKMLLQSDKSPVFRAQQMKKNYIQSLKAPLKKKSVPPCRKSFLLPHNLQPKAKSPLRQPSTKRRTSCRRKSVKTSISKKGNEKDESIPITIQHVLKEFPGLEFPKNILDLLTKRYYQHISLMHKQLKNTLLKKPSTLTQTESAIENEAKLSKILAKDLQAKSRLKELHEQKNLENTIKSSLRNARFQSVKLRQYYDEFHKAMSKKMKKKNFSEEVLVEKTFKQILDIQKENVRLVCQKVREADEKDAKQCRQYLLALKNLYQEQLDVLTEMVKEEQRDTSSRAKAQSLATEKLFQEIRKTLQNDVRSLQKDVLDMIEDIHFRELDAQNFITNFQQQDS